MTRISRMAESDHASQSKLEPFGMKSASSAVNLLWERRCHPNSMGVRRRLRDLSCVFAQLGKHLFNPMAPSDDHLPGTTPPETLAVKESQVPTARAQSPLSGRDPATPLGGSSIRPRLGKTIDQYRILGQWALEAGKPPGGLEATDAGRDHFALPDPRAIGQRGHGCGL